METKWRRGKFSKNKLLINRTEIKGWMKKYNSSILDYIVWIRDRYFHYEQQNEYFKQHVVKTKRRNATVFFKFVHDSYPFLINVMLIMYSRAAGPDEMVNDIFKELGCEELKLITISDFVPFLKRIFDNYLEETSYKEIIDVLKKVKNLNNVNSDQIICITPCNRNDHTIKTLTSATVDKGQFSKRESEQPRRPCWGEEEHLLRRKHRRRLQLTQLYGACSKYCL